MAKHLSWAAFRISQKSVTTSILTSDFTPKANVSLALASAGSCLLALPLLPACPLCCCPLTSLLQAVEKKYAQFVVCMSSTSPVCTPYFPLENMAVKGNPLLQWCYTGFRWYKEKIINGIFQLSKSMASVVLGVCYKITKQQGPDLTV